MKIKKSILKNIIKEEVLAYRKQNKLKESLRKSINTILSDILGEVSTGATSFVSAKRVHKSAKTAASEKKLTKARADLVTK